MSYLQSVGLGSNIELGLVGIGCDSGFESSGNLDSNWQELTGDMATGSLTAGSSGALSLTLAYSGAGNGWTVSGTPVSSVVADGFEEGSYLYLDNLPFDVLIGDIILVRFDDLATGTQTSATLSVLATETADVSTSEGIAVGWTNNGSDRVRPVITRNNADVLGLNTTGYPDIRAVIHTGPESINGAVIQFDPGTATGIGTQSNVTPGVVSTLHLHLLVTLRDTLRNAGTLNTRIYLRRIRPSWTDVTLWTELTSAHTSGSLQAGSAGSLGASLSYGAAAGWAVTGTAAAVTADGVTEASSLLLDQLGMGFAAGDVVLTLFTDMLAPSGSNSVWQIGWGVRESTSSTATGIAVSAGRTAAEHVPAVMGASSDAAGSATLLTTAEGCLFLGDYQTGAVQAGDDGTTNAGAAGDAVSFAAGDFPMITVGTRSNFGFAVDYSQKMYVQRILRDADWS